MKAFHYVAPTSVQQAVRVLGASRGEVRPLAGGTDLIPQMKAGRKLPDVVLDTKRIPACARLEVRGRRLHVGAATSCSAIAGHAAVQERYPVLAQVCRLIGSVQIQNRASIGGNLCNAAPSADSAPALICLGARARIAGPRGSRQVMLEDLFTGPGSTVLEPDELLVELIVPEPAPHSAAHYERFTPRAEMDIAFAGVGVFLAINPRTRKCTRARITLAAVAPTPLRAGRAEEVLAGRTLTRDLISEAAEHAASAARPITDQRASAEYRRELVRTLTRRTLMRCAQTLGLRL